MDVPPDSKPRRHANAVYREVGDEGGLVVLPGKAEVKVLNPVGSMVFDLLDGSRSVTEIAGAVTAEYEVSEAQAIEDVQRFVRELAKSGMMDLPAAAGEVS
jgi:hypothetical protein